MSVEAGALVFNPFEPGFFDDPYPHYAALREHAPVHLHPLGPWFLFRYRDVRAVIGNPDLSVEAAHAHSTDRLDLFQKLVEQRGLPADVFERGSRAILNIDPPDHTRIRRLLGKAFTPKVVQDLRPRAQAIVDGLLDDAEAAGGMDLIADLAYLLPVTVISEMLGMPRGDHAQLREWSHTMAGSLEPVMDMDTLNVIFDTTEAMRAYMKDVIAEKRRHPGDDLLTAMIEAEEDGDVLSEDELLENVILLYIAGHETTVNLIGNGVLALVRNPDQMARLAEDPSLDANAVEELLRYDSPVQFTRRVTLAPMEVAGYEIEPGAFVLCCLGSANHDSEEWGPTAEQLDLGRDGARHQVSFGSGVHHCLGAALARMEGQVAIGTLVRRFPGLAQAGDPVSNHRVVLRGYDSLPVSF